MSTALVKPLQSQIISFIPHRGPNVRNAKLPRGKYVVRVDAELSELKDKLNGDDISAILEIQLTNWRISGLDILSCNYCWSTENQFCIEFP